VGYDWHGVPPVVGQMAIKRRFTGTIKILMFLGTSLLSRRENKKCRVCAVFWHKKKTAPQGNPHSTVISFYTP
jgi:hypothetical protein